MRQIATILVGCGRRLGAIVGTLLWLIASGGFAGYAANFGKYNETYGGQFHWSVRAVGHDARR